MKFYYEIRLSGNVGQGLLMVGKIIAEAVAIYDNHNAIQSQSYGEESRGEANRTDIIISNKEILSPKVENPDLLLCLNQIAYEKYGKSLKDSGCLIIDSNHVVNISDTHHHIYDFPIFQAARNLVGNESEAVFIALGIITRLVKSISVDSIEKAIQARIPKGTEQIYKKCLEIGYQMANQRIKEERDKQNINSNEHEHS